MSFYEEQNPADISVKEILPYVKRFLPNIQSNSIRFFYHGTYNVFDLNDNFILRIPDREFRNEEGLEMLQREMKVLDFLRDKIDISIPKILYLHESNELPFSIHKKIPGKSLVFVFNQLNNQQKKDIGVIIGQFLSILHSEEHRSIFEKNFSKDDRFSIRDSEFKIKFKNFWEQRYNETKIIAFKYLNQKQKKWLTNVFEEYLNNKENFTFSPRISHCDFDISNILVKNSIVTGIIDFEDCQIWDPVVDLLFFDEGSIFLETILENYEFSDQNSLHRRMKFFFSRTCVPYLVWGSQHDRPGMIEEGLRRIKKNMKLFPE